MYLRAEPKTVYERIKARARSEENLIPIEYLQSLHDLHEDWLTSSNDKIGAPVLILDADTDLSSMLVILCFFLTT